ncbi:hypothetical protein ACLOJK_025179 [Asimina triloba]
MDLPARSSALLWASAGSNGGGMGAGHEEADACGGLDRGAADGMDEMGKASVGRRRGSGSGWRWVGSFVWRRMDGAGRWGVADRVDRGRRAHPQLLPDSCFAGSGWMEGGVGICIGVARWVAGEEAESSMMEFLLSPACDGFGQSAMHRVVVRRMGRGGRICGQMDADRWRDEDDGLLSSGGAAGRRWRRREASDLTVGSHGCRPW